MSLTGLINNQHKLIALNQVTNVFKLINRVMTKCGPDKFSSSDPWRNFFKVNPKEVDISVNEIATLEGLDDLPRDAVPTSV